MSTSEEPFGAFLRTLTGIRRVPAAVRVRRFRRDFVRGLALREILVLIERHDDCAETILAALRLSAVPPDDLPDITLAAFVDVVFVAMDLRNPGWRLVIARQANCLGPLIQQIADLTSPADVVELFRPAKGGDDGDADDDRDDEDAPYAKPVVGMIKQALALEAAGHGDVFAWTPGRIVFAHGCLSERAGEDARRSLVDGAVAARLAWADKRGFEKALKEISR